MKLGTLLKLSAAVAAIGVTFGTVPAVIGSAAAPVSTKADPDVLRIIWQVGHNHDASPTVMLAAFETCVVESGCRNLPGGDRDSAGAFQQRPSMGWGTYREVTDVRYAARQFFTRAIASQHCCRTSGLLAQHVQKSCCPSKYDQHETPARAAMAKAARLNGATP